jgi:hypothetical protein
MEKRSLATFATLKQAEAKSISQNKNNLKNF